jgi:arginine/lysine/ornithine decarboxylase
MTNEKVNKVNRSFTIDADVLEKTKKYVTNSSVSEYINELMKKDLEIKRKEKVRQLFDELTEEVRKNPLTKEEYEYAKSIIAR